MKNIFVLFSLGILILLFGLASCTAVPTEPQSVATTSSAFVSSPTSTREISSISTSTLTPGHNTVTPTNRASATQAASIAMHTPLPPSQFDYEYQSATQSASISTRTPRVIPSHTPTPFPTLVPTIAPLTNDAFFSEMRERGYTIKNVASIEDGRYTYYAYLFREPRENASTRYADVIRETWILAIYRSDGKQNELMGTFYPASWSKHASDDNYPILYEFVNWDATLQTFFLFDMFYEPSEETRATSGLSGYKSDINQNGRPEFGLIAQYCPVSCSHPINEFHFFEITKTGKPIDLAAGLAGHLGLSPSSTDPIVFSASEQYWYGYTSRIYIPHSYEWRDEQFIEITMQDKDFILEWQAKSIAQLQANYGQPFSGESVEAEFVSIPMVYQSIGMGREGLTLFLEVSNPANWQNTSPENLCWLQYVRAHFQDEFYKNVPFSVPTDSLSLTAISTQYLQEKIDLFDPKAYDLSACYALLAGE